MYVSTSERKVVENIREKLRREGYIKGNNAIINQHVPYGEYRNEANREANSKNV